MKKLSAICLFVLFILSSGVSVNTANGQCAMCKSTVESNQKEQVVLAKQKAEGLNTGILYLMVLPYVIFGIIGYLWYKNSRKEKTERERIENVLKKAIG